MVHVVAVPFAADAEVRGRVKLCLTERIGGPCRSPFSWRCGGARHLQLRAAVRTCARVGAVTRLRHVHIAGVEGVWKSPPRERATSLAHDLWAPEIMPY